MKTSASASVLVQPPVEARTSGAEALVSAAAGQIATRGLAAVSSRSVAQEAGVSPSAINYNFGGIEQLFGLAFARGAQLSEVWRAGCLADIALLPKSPAGAALALEHVISAWTLDGRRLALLYQEALAAAAGEGPVAAWTAGWRDFWLRAAALFGLGEAEGRMLHLFFESEALYHLSAWSPALERAALREMCAHFAAVYLGARPAPPLGALDAAENAAGVLREGGVPATAVKIVEAAAAVVMEKGLPGLTHRAVAQRAGVTTGSVTHHFRTMESLVAGTIRGQVMALRDPKSGEATDVRREPATAEDLFAALRAHVIVARMSGAALLRRRLFLACLRRPELAASAAVIRFAHGGTLGASFDRVFHPPPEELSLYAGTLARMTGGCWFAASAEPAPREAQTAVMAAMEARVRRRFPQA